MIDHIVFAYICQLLLAHVKIVHKPALTWCSWCLDTNIVQLRPHGWWNNDSLILSPCQCTSKLNSTLLLQIWHLHTCVLFLWSPWRSKAALFCLKVNSIVPLGIAFFKPKNYNPIYKSATPTAVSGHSILFHSEWNNNIWSDWKCLRRRPSTNGRKGENSIIQKPRND